MRRSGWRAPKPLRTPSARGELSWSGPRVSRARGCRSAALSATSARMDMSRHRKRERSPWAAELRATIALSWPLVLTNVAQSALMTSDVILMGWIGPQALAAGALGTNLYFAFLIFAIGLVSATSPLAAEELGRKRHAVRDVRRTVRQGFWAAATIAVPISLATWNGERILLAMGQDPDLSKAAGDYVRALQWSLLPFLFYLVLRSFLAAL